MPPRSGLIDQAVITTAQTGDTRQPNEHAGQFSWPTYCRLPGVRRELL